MAVPLAALRRLAARTLAAGHGYGQPRAATLPCSSSGARSTASQSGVAVSEDEYPRYLYRPKAHVTWPKQLNSSIQEVDPEMADIIEGEKNRQWKGLDLVASENLCSIPVMQAQATVFANVVGEGYPGARWTAGNEFIDKQEILCAKRALEAFRLDPAKWGVNVQCLSGTPANFQVYTALLNPHERIMGMDLLHGGHMSHGYQTGTKKISATAIFFESLPYRVKEETGIIDYDGLETSAALFRPKIIVAGASAYSRFIDYARFRKVADQHKAILLADMSHIGGLVAAGVIPSPFDFADVVTTTTHKTLRGPHGALIFFRKGVKEVNKQGQEVHYDFEKRINESVFPGLQGSPHHHTICGLAVALKMATTPEFKAWAQQVLDNAAQLAQSLLEKGYDLVSGGTENHTVLVNLRNKGVDGARVERVMELAHLNANKNPVPGDVPALAPSGLRLGTPAMTSRGLTEDEFVKVAEFFDRAVHIAIRAKAATGPKLKDFKAAVERDPDFVHEIESLKHEVEDFAKQFPTIGFQQSTMKFQD